MNYKIGLIGFVCMLLLNACAGSSDNNAPPAELSLLYQLALGYPNSSDEKRLSRWEKNSISVVTRGNPSVQDLDDLDELLQELNALLPQKHFFRVAATSVKGSPDIEVYYTDSKYFEEIFRDAYARGWRNRDWGMYDAWLDENNVQQPDAIIKAKVAVPSRMELPEYRRSSIRRSFIRSLGFFYKFGETEQETYNRSIFSSYFKERRRDLIHYEKNVIQLLYDPRLQSGDTREQIAAKFAE